MPMSQRKAEGNTLPSVGPKWSYIFNCQKAKKLIPDENSWGEAQPSFSNLHIISKE